MPQNPFKEHISKWRPSFHFLSIFWVLCDNWSFAGSNLSARVAHNWVYLQQWWTPSIVKL
jgi:hypothetical protein